MKQKAHYWRDYSIAASWAPVNGHVYGVEFPQTGHGAKAAIVTMMRWACDSDHELTFGSCCSLVNTIVCCIKPLESKLSRMYSTLREERRTYLEEGDMVGLAATEAELHECEQEWTLVKNMLAAWDDRPAGTFLNWLETDGPQQHRVEDD